jgi:hypothetical protein
LQQLEVFGSANFKFRLKPIKENQNQYYRLAASRTAKDAKFFATCIPN